MSYSAELASTFYGPFRYPRGFGEVGGGREGEVGAMHLPLSLDQCCGGGGGRGLTSAVGEEGDWCYKGGGREGSWGFPDISCICVPMEYRSALYRC